MRKESKDCRQPREKVKKSVMLLQGLVATQSKMLSLGFGRGNYKNKK
jgi:hypothetical protein